MRHPRYCLTHHPGICSNITNATHFSMPPTPTTLAHCPLYPCWCTTHVTHAGTSPQHSSHVTHDGTSATLACYQRKHTTHVSTPLMQARHPRHSRQQKQHAISQSPGYPIKLLKFLGLKFLQEIQQLLLFIFTAFTLRLNFFRGNQSALFKRRLFFQKQIPNYFRKNCFLKLVSF